jgi:hypothetical protein
MSRHENAQKLLIDSVKLGRLQNLGESTDWGIWEQVAEGNRILR